ncbi:MAG TPA: SusC/RagA family TonB-linked outer membrane protein [Gemmatimonadales bacterium]|nr:SusC/RagA family TonB-linked outer membrane protein [Gemmatimonadales bacterium]
MAFRIGLAATLLAGGTLLGASLHAQELATIRGKVTNARTGEPLAVVSVQVQGTELRALTGEDGTYRLTRVPPGPRVLTARRIGFTPSTATVTVQAGETATLDLTLNASATELQAVVVTGTAGNQTRVAQGAVVSTIDVADITTKAPVANVTDLLQGRVAGVSVQNGAGTVGAAPRINIRGATSISLSSEPLVFIDGVRVSSGARKDVGNYHDLEGLGGQTLTALNDLDPNDIESIEIVKGPAAATLYGADASAGVIQIITKKGHAGVRPFRQMITTEWNQVQPNFTPLAVYGTCAAGDTVPGGPALCAGQHPGTVISDNPLERGGVYHNGDLQSLNYSGEGGGDSYGYFVSASVSNEHGTAPNNSYYRRTARSGANWIVNPKLSVDANLGVSYNDYKIPESDDATYGYMAQGEFLSSPFAVTLGPNGQRQGGISTPVVGLASILHQITSTRFTPSAQIHYNPFPWLTNRLTIGGDFSSTHGFTFFPTNTQNWFSGDQANGYVEDVQHPITILTLDYLGNIHRTFGSDGHIASDFSFGSQWINSTDHYLAGVGIGLAANSSNLVSSAAATESHQNFAQTKSLGLLAQEGLSFGQTLFLQVGARIDRNSAFGTTYGALFLPKASVSYVISQQPFWSKVASVVSTLRLRAAYGETGRSPTPGASLRTYAPFTYVTPTGGVGEGVVQASPGNPNLKPERGTEFEAGFDAGFLHERVGLEFTYFDKRTSDLLLQQPLAPSLAYTINPFVNVGKVDNRGIEMLVRATPVDRKTVTWDVAFTANTLRNKLVSLGSVVIPNQAEVSPDLTFRYTPGQPLAGWYSSQVVSVDTVAGFATVTNTPVFAGPQWPTFQANLSNTVTLAHNLKLYALLSGQSGGKIFNVTSLIMDLFGISAETNLPPGQGGYSKAERIRRLGPWRTESGTPVGLVLDSYLQPTDFLRLAELSATYTVPASVAAALHASGASITLAGKNLHLWKSSKYQLWDPGVLSNTANGATAQYATTEEFTVPQPRSFVVRLTLQY